MIDIGIDPQVATLVSGLIGGIVGSIGSYIIQKSSERRRKKSETETLRDSLISELETMEHIDDFDLGPQNIPDKDIYRNEIYSNSSNKLGLLTNQESSAVIHFYGSMGNLQSQIQEFTHAQRQKREISSNSHASRRQVQSEIDNRYSSIVTSFNNMKGHRREALYLLRENRNHNSSGSRLRSLIPGSN